MIDLIAEAIRTQTLAAASIDVDRTHLAPGARWAREGCRTFVVEYVTTRRSNLGEGRQAAQQGVGFSGQCATVRHHDYRVVFVDACYPTGDDDGNPADPAEIQDWSTAFLATVSALDAALDAVDVSALGIMSGVTVGSSQPNGPSGGVAEVAWPVSVSEL